MKRSLFIAIIFLFPLSAVYTDDMYPNIALIQTDADNQMIMGVTEKAAANIFYQTHPDIYDFLIFYHTFTPQLNMQQGLLITYTITGIGREGYNPTGPASAWGSGGRLMGGARMCHIDQYPDDPDSNMPFPLGGLTSTELLAHEMSHYWFAAMEYKKEGMEKNHPGFRGCEGNSGENGACSPNQHWSYYFNSGPSVMYGSDITDNGDGSFTFTHSSPRKYSPFDQYVMGLRAPGEVGELFYLCDYADESMCKEGNPALPTPHTAAPDTVSGKTKIAFTIDDVIRAMGERVPSSTDAPKHFNVGFIMVSKPGFIPFPQQLEKLEKIRVRFQEWFTWATDGRATICTELDGDCESTETPDDDDPVIDEDSVVTEDNTVIPDEEVTPDESVTDNTVTQDESTSQDEQTVQDDNTETPDNSTEQPADEEEVGCGCTIVF